MNSIVPPLKLKDLNDGEWFVFFFDASTYHVNPGNARIYPLQVHQRVRVDGGKYLGDHIRTVTPQTNETGLYDPTVGVIRVRL